MESIVTLTVNPAIDVSTAVAAIMPTRKLRCAEARRDPGGGGINVARAAVRLGSPAAAVYTMGGSTGVLLRRLLDRENVRSLPVEVAQDTREDFTVLEESSGNHYRFVMPGQPLAQREWQACLDALGQGSDPPAFVVGSGSLPPGVPDDFHGRAARIAKQWQAKFILDTSGNALAGALEEGVYLVKPSLRELREIMKLPLVDVAAQLAACHTLIEGGRAEAVALTLGENGALLVTRDGAFRAAAPDVRAVSAVGAGDSFLGGMVASLAAGRSLADAFRWGVAAGSAAVLNPGTELCHAADVARLLDRVGLVRL